MSDIARIEDNVRTMIGKGAPEADIDAYLKVEGHTPDSFRKALDGAPDNSVGTAASALWGKIKDFAGRAGEYRDTRLASAAGSVAGIPKAVAEGLAWVGDKAGPLPFGVDTVARAAKDHLPTGEEAKTFMLDRAKARPGFQERTINPVVDAGVEALFAGPAFGIGGGAAPAALNTGKTLMLSNLPRAMVAPGANFMGGAGGELAGRSAAKIDPDYEMPARAIGAIAAGGIPFALESGAKAVGSMFRALPVTSGGRQQLAADIIAQGATNPGAVTAKLADYAGDAVPGVRQTVGKLTGDEGLLSLENFISGKMGSNAVMDDLRSANNAARTTFLDSLKTGDISDFVGRLRTVDKQLADDIDSAVKALPTGATPAQAGQEIRAALQARKDTLSEARRTVTEPLYAEVEQWGKPLNTWGALTTSADLVKGAKGDIRSDFEKARATLFNDEGKADKSAKGVLAARKAVNRQLGEAGEAETQRGLTQILQALDESIGAVPSGQLARAEYARMSKPLDPFTPDLGPTVFGALERTRPGAPYVQPANLIPESIIRPGERGAASVQNILETGAAPAIAPLRSYVADMVASNPAGAGRVAEKFGPALERLDPSLREQIRKVGSANDAREWFSQTPQGRIAAGSDFGKEIGAVLSNKGGRSMVADMVLRAGNDPAAMDGLRRGILDDFAQTITSRAATDSQGNATLLSAKAKDWVAKKLPNAEAALTKDQRDGIRALVSSLDTEARIAPKMAGSDTVRNLETGTFLRNTIAGRIPVPFVSKWIQDAADRGMNDVYSILAEKLADPVAAKALMMKASPGNAKVAQSMLDRAGTRAASLAAPQAGRGDQR